MTGSLEMIVEIVDDYLDVWSIRNDEEREREFRVRLIAAHNVVSHLLGYVEGFAILSGSDGVELKLNRDDGYREGVDTVEVTLSKSFDSAESEFADRLERIKTALKELKKDGAPQEEAAEEAPGPVRS